MAENSRQKIGPRIRMSEKERPTMEAMVAECEKAIGKMMASKIGKTYTHTNPAPMGKQTTMEVSLDFSPPHMLYFSSGEYRIIAYKKFLASMLLKLSVVHTWDAAERVTGGWGIFYPLEFNIACSLICEIISDKWMALLKEGKMIESGTSAP